MSGLLAPVSVVIPVRNGATFLPEALRSVQAQTILPRQIIVVDDGSTDATATVARDFFGVDCIQQPPLGVSAARNTGAEYATETYLCFLDADDIWPRTKTERQLACFARDPSIDIVTGLMRNFRRSNEGETLFLTEPVSANLPGVLMIRREAFHRVGPYSTELAYGENLEWWARALDSGSLVTSIDELVLMRRIHDNNTSRDTDNSTRRYLHALRAITRRRRTGSASH